MELKAKYDVKLIEDMYRGKSRHQYDVTTSDGKTVRLPGVTGTLNIIAKPALIPWAKKVSLEKVQTALLAKLGTEEKKRVTLDKKWIDDLIQEAKSLPDAVKDEAADIGTEIHAYIDAVVKNQELPNLSDRIRPAIGAFETWRKSTDIKLVAGDTKVASLVLGFGGSLDALGERNGDLIILDWKSSKGIYAEYALQVAAYAVAFQATYGLPIKEGWIIRFGKDGVLEEKKIADIRESAIAYGFAMELKKGMERNQFEEKA